MPSLIKSPVERLDDQHSESRRSFSLFSLQCPKISKARSVSTTRSKQVPVDKGGHPPDSKPATRKIGFEENLHVRGLEVGVENRL